MTTVLVVEDDTALRRALTISIRSRGFDVLEVATGEAALVVVAAERPQLVVLDLGLPDIDGIAVLERVRTFSDVPVIVLTARDRQADKVRVLDAGADDYVTKPFDPEELLARLRAALRRRPTVVPTLVRAGDIEIDMVRRRVSRAGEVVHLTRTELELLENLVRNPGTLVTQAQLLREVWGEGYGTETNYLRVYIAQLRRKLGDDAANPRLILTEPGIGYRWIAGGGGSQD
jgi:two-component system KDP operon response regulator KdpE